MFVEIFAVVDQLGIVLQVGGHTGVFHHKAVELSDSRRRSFQTWRLYRAAGRHAPRPQNGGRRLWRGSAREFDEVVLIALGLYIDIGLRSDQRTQVTLDLAVIRIAWKDDGRLDVYGRIIIRYILDGNGAATQ